VSDRPPAVFVAGPRHWRDLGDALAKRGLEVYGLFSGRPTYNWFPRFIEAEQDHRQMREALLLAEPGRIDLQKSCIAVADPEDGNLELQTRLVALRADLAWAYAMRRAIGPLLTEKWCSAVVTTCTYDPLGRTVVAAARDAGVPVVHVAHSCQSAAPEDAWYAAKDPGDVLCVPGERDRQWWLECIEAFDAPALEGFRLEVTGHPLWDHHWEAPLAETAEAPTVLWACESGASAAQTPRLWRSRETPIEAWQSFLRAMGDLGDVRRNGHPPQLILKARDWEDANLCEAWHAEAVGVLGADRVLTTNAAPEDILSKADVVVCQDSNLGVEALIRGVPVVSLTRDGGCLFDPQPGGSATVLNAHKPRLELGLGNALRAVLEHPPLNREAIREEAARYCAPGGAGMAAVCGVIEEVCGATVAA
jgi:hypothetical protein